jgi:hypothetical protein
MAEQKSNLLPIGTRITHFDGNPEFTHGKGTIIAYNGISPNNYMQTNFKEAVEIAAKAGLIDGLVNGMYDGARCPYVVRFDINSKKVGKYPKGYKDVYERECIQPLMPEENIFPSDNITIMMRTWRMVVDEGKSMSYPEWSAWSPLTLDGFLLMQDPADNDIEFCIRHIAEGK